ncbi:MAG: transporter substrate-binding domain-containing protein, partial [Chloroflexi bacterium]|nr:transporter substrate-binding domain-containing protein [Chloroflexota bacterium]
MNKKWTVGVVALLLVLLLAACGGGAADTAEPIQPAEATAVPETAEQPAADSAALPDLGGREVTIAVENAYLPFNYIDPTTSEPAGWDYDVWNEICSLLNCTPVYVEAG